MPGLLGFVGALLALGGTWGAGQDKGGSTPRPARTPALTEEDKEILSRRELLENLELLRNFEKIKYLDLLGERTEKADPKTKEKPLAKSATKPK